MQKKRPPDDSEKELKRKKLLSEVAKGKLPFLMPGQANFESLMKEKYGNFVLRPSSCVPPALQEELAWALRVLRENDYLSRDWVQVKGQTLPTPVSRTLVGEQGTTYRYLGLRLFTLPWSFGGRPGPRTEIEAACEALGRLNEHYRRVAGRLVAPLPRGDGVEGRASPGHGGTDFNVSLVNYMDPADPCLRLKPEPYYGMGVLAVSWHKDENLVEGSSVAVYNHTCASETHIEGEDGDGAGDWRVGLKVAWDVETPGVAVPLQQGESYFLLAGLNDTHQHCVLAGAGPRFSSTHRVADSRKGTLEYIQEQCRQALSNLSGEGDGDFSLKSLDAECLEFTETVHNELEFEWLRQFWMQGARHARERAGWVPAMEALEADWSRMEHMTRLALREAGRLGGGAGTIIANGLLPQLQHRQQKRQECQQKFPPSLLDRMQPDQRPIHRPMWAAGDLPARPMPFDLEGPIGELRLVCRKAKSDT